MSCPSTASPNAVPSTVSGVKTGLHVVGGRVRQGEYGREGPPAVAA